MGIVVDGRPDRFLREMREHGNVNTACKNAGMTCVELADLLFDSAEFDRAHVECSLEYTEESIMAEARKRLGRIRTSAISDWKGRHGVTPDG